MKKFLEDLEKELKKLKVNEQEIAEILADHKEMIESGKAEGLDESDMNKKFGDPETIAKEIYTDSQETSISSTLYAASEDCTKDLNEDGFSLVKSFIAEDISGLVVKVVSDDIVIIPHSEDTIVVYQKGVKDIEKYTIQYENNRFELSKDKVIKVFSMKKSSGEFIVKIPETALIRDYSINTVSGDFTANNIKSVNLKIKSVSGDLELSNVLGKDFNLTTVSGDAEISKVAVDTFDINTVSGDFELSKVSVKGLVDINTVNGDFEVEDGECSDFQFKAVNGDFDGSDFYPSKVILVSVNGDISIQNEDKTRLIEVVRKKSLSGDININ